MSTPLQTVPVHDRPRERLLQHGAGAMSDAELVALQLGSGRVGASALEIAYALLAEWGGMTGLSRARPEELVRTPGVGAAKAARLTAAFALAGRASGGSAQVARLTSSGVIAAAARTLIGAARTERVLVLIADNGLRLRRCEVVASGSATACPVPVREIVSAVLRHGGVAFAVAHNHPAGDPTPSGADRRATEALRDAARATGLRFLDHIVLGADAWASAAA